MRKLTEEHKKKIGDAHRGRFRNSLKYALNNYEEDGSGCWIWVGSFRGEYGRAWYQGKAHGAHRLMFQKYFGPIPDGAQIDHICENKLCVNPDHLECVSPKQNTLRIHHREHSFTCKEAVFCTECNRFLTTPTGQPVTPEELEINVNAAEYVKQKLELLRESEETIQDYSNW